MRDKVTFKNNFDHYIQNNAEDDMMLATLGDTAEYESV